LLRFLPRESVTVQEILGDEARWSDTEHLLALAVDSMRSLNWLYSHGSRAFKGVPKKPPDPVRRPGDVSQVDGMTLTRNVSEKTQVTAGSLTLADLDAAIARQTGTRSGIAEEV
jgi:hypothetical protein